MKSSKQTEKYIKLGNEAGAAGDIYDAIKQYQKALTIESDNVVAWGNLGVMLEQLGRDREAEEAIRQAIMIAPDYGKGYYNLGMLMVKMRRPSEAADFLEKAVELAPEKIEYVFNQGVNLQKMGKVSEQIESFEKVAHINPDYPEIYYWLWLAYRRIARWERIGGIELMLQIGVEHDPFINVVRSEDPADNLKVARFASAKLDIKLPLKKRKLANKKIRIGYFSNDLRDHPVGQMVAGMFALHDRSRFEVVAFHSEADDKSEIYQQIKNGVDDYVDLSDKKLTNEQMAKTIYDKKIDILVEMTGHTKDNHLGVLAYQPARVQVEWLGFPGTTGAEFMDYIIVDKVVAPVGDQQYFSEELVYLPHCYQVNTPVAISKHKYKRSDFGLPDPSTSSGQAGFVFSSFNQVYKIDPVMWRVWMKILKRVRGSVLWLWGQHPECVKNLKMEAEKSGVNPARIIFSKSEKKTEHLGRLGLSDLGLDTLIYGGHTTTTDCLWAGVPVITRQGTHFASRVGASILREVGLGQLVVKNLQEYEDLAVKLANEPAKMKKLKEQLSHNKLRKNLFNTKRFVRELEAVYERIAK